MSTGRFHHSSVSPCIYLVGGKIGGANSAEVVAAVENCEMRPLNDVWIVKKLLCHFYKMSSLSRRSHSTRLRREGWKEGMFMVSVRQTEKRMQGPSTDDLCMLGTIHKGEGLAQKQT